MHVSVMQVVEQIHIAGWTAGCCSSVMLQQRGICMVMPASSTPALVLSSQRACNKGRLARQGRLPRQARQKHTRKCSSVEFAALFSYWYSLTGRNASMLPQYVLLHAVLSPFRLYLYWGVPGMSVATRCALIIR
jgi:hypothetical protein